MTLFDAHCHLDFPQFDNDWEEVIERARNRDINMINSGIGTASIKRTLKMSNIYQEMYATLGFQPSVLDRQKAKEVQKLIQKNKRKIIGIGEVGMDYYWVRDTKKRKKQKNIFREFVELSSELNSLW